MSGLFAVGAGVPTSESALARAMTKMTFVTTCACWLSRLQSHAVTKTDKLPNSAC